MRDNVCICKRWWIKNMRIKKKEHWVTPNSSLLETSQQQMQRHCWMLVCWVCSPGDILPLQPQQDTKRPGPSNMLMSISMFVSHSNKEPFLLNMSIYCVLIVMEWSSRNWDLQGAGQLPLRKGDCDMKFRLTLVFIDGHPKVDYFIKYFYFLPLQIYFYFWYLFNLLLLNSKP